ncbi:MAG: hypothetical protein U1A78_18235 [Polyangia bacterium]
MTDGATRAATERDGASAGRLPLASWALGLCGAGLLAVPGRRFRIDTATCADWPPHVVTALYSGAYLLGLVCLTLCWLRCRQQARAGRLRLRHVLGIGLSIHLVALISAPFLSNDPLFYAAIGRVIATFHGSPYTQVIQVLPPGDPFLTVLPVRWAYGVSPYFPGFNALAAAVARLGGDDLGLHLRIYQGLGLLSMLAVTLVVAATARARGRAQGSAMAAGTMTSLPSLSPLSLSPLSLSSLSAAAGRLGVAEAAALVFLCPLAVIEGTLNAHNDGLLALAAALYALCLTTGHLGLAFLPLLFGVSIKASAGLLLVLHAAYMALSLRRVLRRAGLPLRLGLAAAALVLAAAGLWRVAPHLTHYAHALHRLLGSPSEAHYYCTRAVECLPRSFFYFVLNNRPASWLIGLLFRLAGVAFLLYVAWRADRERDYLGGAAAFIGIYYLYLHAYSQPWYLLALLPLLPHAPGRLRRVLSTFCISAVSYYVVRLPFSCDSRTLPNVLIEVIEPLLVLGPPTWLLWRGRRAAAAETT